MSKTAIYAGTFDPITLGHADLIGRASKMFDRLIVAVAGGVGKRTMFSVDERLEMVRETVAGWPNVEVYLLQGLLVGMAESVGASVLVRGLRAYSDFEYEFQMALTNRKLSPDVETIFLMPKETLSYISSSLVREIARNGGDARGFVPASVVDHLRKHMQKYRTD